MFSIYVQKNAVNKPGYYKDTDVLWLDQWQNNNYNFDLPCKIFHSCIAPNNSSSTREQTGQYLHQNHLGDCTRENSRKLCT